MRLSEAILLGSVGTKQGFGPWAIHGGSVEKCALGSALYAVGESVIVCTRAYDKIKELWPWVQTSIPTPEVLKGIHFINGDREKRRVMELIWALNDVVRWTRPQIAAWVAEQEVRLGLVTMEIKEEVKETENASA